VLLNERCNIVMVFGQVHQLVGSTEVDMYKMSAIGHLLLLKLEGFLWDCLGDILT